MGTKQKPCDWIIYYNEGTANGRYVKCIPVGAKEVPNITGTVLRGFYGTAREAKAEANRLNAEFEAIKLNKRHFVKKEVIL